MDTNTDNRNITDFYKHDRLTKWTTELIKKDLQSKAFPYAVAMENLLGDFNLSSVIRSANGFNAKEVYYIGNKHYDRRGTVGTHHYTDVIHLKKHEQLLELKEKYEIVGVENTIAGAIRLDRIEYTKPVLFLLGEEGVGLTQEAIEICDRFVFIQQYGSVRSLNAAVAGSIIMNDFVTKYTNNNLNF
jgi:tRNA G18 (ribose-2'-O)-methylase SpoU